MRVVWWLCVLVTSRVLFRAINGRLLTLTLLLWGWGGGTFASATTMVRRSTRVVEDADRVVAHAWV